MERTNKIIKAEYKKITKIDFRDGSKNDFDFVFSFFGVSGLLVFSGFTFSFATDGASRKIQTQKKQGAQKHQKMKKQNQNHF